MLTLHPRVGGWAGLVLQELVISKCEDLPHPCRYLLNPLPNIPCLYDQVQTEVHVGSVAMDTDWSEIPFCDAANGHSYHEAACQCFNLPYGY